MQLRRLPVRCLTLTICCLTLITVSGCGATVREYLEGEDQLGIAQTPGTIVKISGLHSSSTLFLSDGVILSVSDESCRVTMRDGESEQEFTIPPGSSIILGHHRDWILQPHAGPSLPSAQETSSSSQDG